MPPNRATSVGAPFVPLNDLVGHRSPIGSALAPTRDRSNGWRRAASVLPAGVLIHRLGTGVQAIKLSPYRAGLAEPALQRFGAVAALPTCYFPPRLLLRGASVGPGTPSEFLLGELGILCRVTQRTEGEERLVSLRCDLGWAHPPSDVFLGTGGTSPRPLARGGHPLWTPTEASARSRPHTPLRTTSVGLSPRRHGRQSRPGRPQGTPLHPGSRASSRVPAGALLLTLAQGAGV